MSIKLFKTVFNIYLIVFFSTNLKSQNCDGGQLITGIISDTTVNISKIYIAQFRDTQPIDSAIVKNKQFRFCLPKIDLPAYYVWAEGYRGLLVMFVADYKDEVKIEFSSFKKRRYFTTSTIYNDKWNKYSELVAGVYNKYRSYTNAKLVKDSVAFKRQTDSLLYDVCEEMFHNDQFIFLSVLSSHFNTIKVINPSFYTLNKLRNLFQKLDTPYRTSKWATDIVDYINKSELLMEGKPIFDFKLASCKGDSISTFNYRNQYLVIDFWASWCGPCKIKNKTLAENYQKIRDSNIDILGVFIDAEDNGINKSNLAELCTKADIYPWKQAMISNDNLSKAVMDNYKVMTVPKTLVCSKEGKIIGLDPHTVDDIFKMIKDFEKK